MKIEFPTSHLQGMIERGTEGFGNRTVLSFITDENELRLILSEQAEKEVVGFLGRYRAEREVRDYLANEVAAYFERLRFSNESHIGLGNIRMTVEQQDEIIMFLTNAISLPNAEATTGANDENEMRDPERKRSATY